MSDTATPLMRQYHGIKQQVPNALLMFRLGDFYELFFEDAVTAARELEITLTARNKEKGAAIPMCGVPYHSADGYISRLIQRGYPFADKEEAHRFFTQLTGLLKNLNYTPRDAQDYTGYLAQVDDLVKTLGRPPAATPDGAGATSPAEVTSCSFLC